MIMSSLIIFLVSFSEKSVLCPMVEIGPKVDGSLGDSIWQKAISFDDFIEVFPNEAQIPVNKTICYILSDRDNLYFGFECYNCDKIIASNVVYDKMSRDEKINILLSPSNDQNTAYALFVSPLNTQIDIKLLNNGEKMVDWDGIWYSATKKTSNGWSCEIKIPFRLFKECAGQKYWGVEIVRETYVRDQQILIRWAKSTYELLRPSDFGRLYFTEEIPFLGEAAFMPTFVAQKKFLLDSVSAAKAEIGGEMVFSPFIFSDFHLVFNPDYSQVEADPEEIDLSKTLRRLPEKRNFFLSGFENYKTPIEVMYTRRLNEINQGGKARLRISRLVIDGLYVATDSTTTEPAAKILSAALNLNLFQNSNVKLLYLNKYISALFNNDFSVFFYQPLPKDFSLSSQFAFDWIENAFAKAYYLSIERPVFSGVRISAYHKAVDSLFVAPLGYIPFKNIRETYANVSWFNLINRKLFRSFDIGFSALYRASLHGDLICQNFTPFLNITFISPLSVHYAYTVEERLFGMEMYNNVTHSVEVNIYPVRWFSFIIGYFWGTYFGNHIDYLSLSLGNLNIANRFFLELNTQSQRLENGSEKTVDNVGNFRISLFIFKNIYIRHFFKYSDLSKFLNANFILDYNVAPGSHLYFILNEERENTRSIFATDFRKRIFLLKFAYRLSF